ncbi:MAG: histidine kinase [Verrucomicrobia bacterium]|nr:histidine kinase [Verrucomicrobiota bacterium]
MLITLTLLLALALGVTLIKLVNHQHAIRSLHQAILKRRPLLREDLPSLSGSGWEQLCTLSNDLITEATHLQQLRSGQLAQLEATLGNLQEAVLIVDSNNYILLANKALQSIFPRAVNILGQRLELVLHSVTFLGYVEAVRRGTGQPQHEIEFIEGSQSSTWLEVTGVTIPAINGQKAPWTLFVLHNITKQKKLEAVRKDFVANVSHELRTPLSVIKGYVETLVDDTDGIPAQDRARFLKTIQRHTERLNSLLEDLLVLSRLESINPGIRRETVEFNTFLSNIIDDYRARPAGKGHQLEFQGDKSISPLAIDPLKLTQVVENLLDNALKYTPKGSLIGLHVLRQDAGEVIVCLRDNGPGIPEDDLPHIFERFYRVDKGRSREKGGTGLGLSIVKHIIQLHAGRVWVESRLGQGTAFFFSLPIRLTS